MTSITKTLLVSTLVGLGLAQATIPQPTNCTTNTMCGAGSCCIGATAMYFYNVTDTTVTPNVQNMGWTAGTPIWACLNATVTVANSNFNDTMGNMYQITSSQCMGYTCNVTSQCQTANLGSNYCCTPSLCAVGAGANTPMNICQQPNFVSTTVPYNNATWTCSPVGYVNNTINQCLYQPGCSGSNFDATNCTTGNSCVQMTTYQTTAGVVVMQPITNMCGSTTMCGTLNAVNITGGATTASTFYGCPSAASGSVCSNYTANVTNMTPCSQQTTNAPYCCASVTATPVTGSPVTQLACIPTSMSGMTQTQNLVPFVMTCLNNAKVLAASATLFAALAFISI